MEMEAHARRPQPIVRLFCPSGLCQTEAEGGLDGIAGVDGLAFAVVADPFPPADVGAPIPVIDVEGNSIGLDFGPHVLGAVRFCPEAGAMRVGEGRPADMAFCAAKIVAPHG